MAARTVKATARPGKPASPGDGLVTTLRRRFEAHPDRHSGLGWMEVEARLDAALGRRRNRFLTRFLQERRESSGKDVV